MTDEQDAASAPAPSREVAVGPFDFFPEIASKLPGLGGSAPGHDPHYVFHTPYFQTAPGPSRFVVWFHDLTARRGTLWLRVHMLPLEPGARAVMANSDRIQINRLIQNGGRCEIGFEGFRGMSFALYAGIQGETDAKASGIEVWLDRPADPDRISDVVADGRNTQFGHDMARPAIHMLAIGRPSFAAPVTQLATASQIAEPAYRDLAARIPTQPDTLIAWQELFVHAALQRYGMIRPGAIGLGIMRDGDGLCAAMATEVALRRISPGGGIGDGVVALDPFPHDLVNFDFLWSVAAWDELESPAASRRFVEASLNALRPGGIAVHCGAYALRPLAAPPSALARPEVERLLLNLISRGHEVAQFQIPGDDALSGPDGSTGAIGIIVRKAISFV